MEHTQQNNNMWKDSQRMEASGIDWQVTQFFHKQFLRILSLRNQLPPRVFLYNMRQQHFRNLQDIPRRLAPGFNSQFSGLQIDECFNY